MAGLGHSPSRMQVSGHLVGRLCVEMGSRVGGALSRSGLGRGAQEAGEKACQQSGRWEKRPESAQVSGLMVFQPEGQGR
jgi:hypothetical protein